MEVKKITSIERLATIKTKIAAAAASPPPGWQDWPADRIAQFKADYAALASAGSVPKALPIASRLAGLYGLDLATIDPLHGQA